MKRYIVYYLFCVLIFALGCDSKPDSNFKIQNFETIKYLTPKISFKTNKVHYDYLII